MTLSERKRIIILTLIVKGILLYTTVFASAFAIVFAGSLSSLLCLVPAIVLGYICTVTISSNDFKRLLFLSRKERIAYDNESV